MKAKPARKPPARPADIRQALEREIHSGRLAPGTLLDERDLAKQFGVSRTPVREALARLAAQNLVTVAPRRGAMVTRLTVTELRALLELLGEMEALAAKFSARRMDAAERKALAESTRRCTEAAKAGDRATYMKENVAFHQMVHAGCRNPSLIAQLRLMHRQIQRYRANDFQTPAEMRRSAGDHEAIAKAILAGDEAGAQAEMLRHTPSGTTGFAEFLSRLPPGFLDDGETAAQAAA